MSQENVEVVRRHMEAYLAGNYEGALDAYAPDVEIDVSVRPGGRVYRGRGGVIEAFRVWRGTFKDWEGAVEEVVGARDRVLLVLRESGRGKGSGVKVEQQTFFVYTLRGGMIAHATVLMDEEEARQAAGLRE
jgi:ketosteroid isomerase-like protein